MTLLAPAAVGDVLDRITILTIKAARLSGKAREHAAAELAALQAVWKDAGLGTAAEQAELATVNTELWDVEEKIRQADTRGDFGPAFVNLARRVHRLNDRRASIKRTVNLRLGSAIVEEKSYR